MDFEAMMLPIREEMRKQDQIFGSPQRHSLSEWLTILAEQQGKLAHAVVVAEREMVHNQSLSGEARDEIKQYLRQVVAVSFQFLERLQQDTVLRHSEDSFLITEVL